MFLPRVRIRALRRLPPRRQLGGPLLVAQAGVGCDVAQPLVEAAAALLRLPPRRAHGAAVAHGCKQALHVVEAVGCMGGAGAGGGGGEGRKGSGWESGWEELAAQVVRPRSSTNHTPPLHPPPSCPAHLLPLPMMATPSSRSGASASPMRMCNCSSGRAQGRRDEGPQRGGTWSRRVTHRGLPALHARWPDRLARLLRRAEPQRPPQPSPTAPFPSHAPQARSAARPISHLRVQGGSHRQLHHWDGCLRKHQHEWDEGACSSRLGRGRPLAGRRRAQCRF